MAYFIWKDSFSVHVAELDQQHRLFFELVNRLYDAIQSGQGKQVLVRIFQDLSDHTARHFTAEENMLRDVNYPGLDTQKKHHDFFIAEIASLKKEVEENQERITVRTSDFLKDWFLNHVLQLDKQYADYLEEARHPR